MSLGQKRKRGSISLQEEGGLTARKRPQTQGLPCDSAYFDHHEFANMGAWQPPQQYKDASMSRYTLAMPGQYREVTRSGVMKNIPIWVSEADRWRETQFGNENLVPALTDRYHTGSGRQLESAKGPFQAKFYDLLTDLGTLNTEALSKATQPTKTIDDIFYYEANYKVLICKHHGLAVVGLNGHLKDAHNLRKTKDRQPFLDRFAGLAIAKPADVVLPPMNGPPFAALRKPAPAFSCIDCGYLSTNKHAIREHCNRLWCKTFLKGAIVGILLSERYR